MDAQTVFRLWPGPWRFARTIVHAASFNSPDRVYGRACVRWLKKPNVLSYREDGLLYRAHHAPLAVRRQYVYSGKSDDTTFSAYFGGTASTTGLFHTFVLTPEPTTRFVVQANKALRVWNGFGEHVCGEDRYEAHYQFTLENGFLRTVRITHWAKGPQKNYRATAIYARYATMLRRQAR